jgi:hypothetical protein
MLVAALAFTGLGAAASSYSDGAGDTNEAPDVRSVTVSEATPGTVSVSVAVGNFETLPADSWFNLWFDLDSDPSTGDDGDEALVRYVSDGTIQFYSWNGSQLVAQAATGIAVSFREGLLTMTASSAAFADVATFGVLVVASRAQELGESTLVASDFAPDSGRSAYAAPAPMAFADPGDDHDAAPDVTSVQVSDAKSGWITIAITTPNYVQLPATAGLIVTFDRDNRVVTGDGGADVVVTSIDGRFSLERWDVPMERWIADDEPTRVRVRNSGNVVVVEIHRSELDNAARFGFAVAAFDTSALTQAPLAFDFAPDSVGFYRYALANKAALVLTTTRLIATPSKPKAGGRFTVSFGVLRSDTNRRITSGTVACKVSVGAKRVRARGSVAGGNARCSLLVPATSSGSTLRGSIRVTAGGKSVAKSFAFSVR